MNKLVYLFELDSVRNSYKEIEIAQQAMFEEIILNGNKVVLSFNQLTDSKGFLNMLQDEDTYNSLMELVKQGVIKVSLYKQKVKDKNGKDVLVSLRTPSQYIQKAIENCNDNNGFIFSGLPVLSSDKAMLGYIKNALQYNDIKKFEELMDNAEDQEEREKLEFLYRYVKLILRMSWNSVSGNPIKDGKTKTFIEFMDDLLEQSQQELYIDQINEKYRSKYLEACSLLAEIGIQFKNQSNNKINQRSAWVNALVGKNEDMSETNTIIGDDVIVYMANAIIDLCYNYAIEDGIWGVSKHYIENDKQDFYKDYCKRFNEYWGQATVYNNGIHEFPTKDEKRNIPYVDSGISWGSAVRTIQTVNLSKKVTVDFNCNEVGCVYEDRFEEERCKWKKFRTKSMTKFFISTGIYMLVFFAIELLMGQLEDGFALTGLLSGIVFDIVSIALFCFVGVGVSWVVRKLLKKDCPDLVESFKELINAIVDNRQIKKAPNGISYKRIEI